MTDFAGTHCLAPPFPHGDDYHIALESNGGEYRLEQKEAVTVNESLKVSCGDGRMFKGSDAATKNVRCGEDGRWSVDDPGQCQGKSDSVIIENHLSSLMGIWEMRPPHVV